MAAVQHTTEQKFFNFPSDTSNCKPCLPFRAQENQTPNEKPSLQKLALLKWALVCSYGFQKRKKVSDFGSLCILFPFIEIILWNISVFHNNSNITFPRDENVWYDQFSGYENNNLLIWSNSVMKPCLNLQYCMYNAPWKTYALQILELREARSRGGGKIRKRIVSERLRQIYTANRFVWSYFDTEQE